MCISFLICLLQKKKKDVKSQAGVVAHTCNSSTQKTEAGGSLGVPCQHELHSTVRPDLALE